MRRIQFTCALLSMFAWFAFAPRVLSQEPSADRKNPTPFTANSIEGEYDGDATTHYFRFIANKGEVKVSVNATTKAYSTLMDVELLDESGKSLEKFSVAANMSGRTEAVTRSFVRRQPVIVKVFMREDRDIKHLKYEIDLAGPVEFDGGGTAARATPAAQGERMCLPAAGTLVLTLQDGSAHEVDLAQVTKATIKN